MTFVAVKIFASYKQYAMQFRRLFYTNFESFVFAIFTRDSHAKRVLTIIDASVRPYLSVCVSVTLCDCIKTMQARMATSSLSAATKTLVL